jgi:nucleoside-diphosphate-sugar epimerase
MVATVVANHPLAACQVDVQDATALLRFSLLEHHAETAVSITMKMFVIGATGFLGSAITEQAVAAGHDVIGFARSDAGAEKVGRLGAKPFIGDLADLGSVAGPLDQAEVLIFAPQIPTLPEENVIVARLLQRLFGSGKTFLFTSGSGLLGQRTEGEWSEDSFAEDDDFMPPKYVSIRRCTEIEVRSAAWKGVRSIVIRPPAIWGNGYHPFVDLILTSVEKTGSACYYGAGRNMYSQVNVRDLADLFLVAAEKGEPGALYHAASGEMDNRTIAEHVGRQQGVPTRSLTLSESIEVWGKFTSLCVFGVCSRTRAPRSRKELGWRPHRLDLADQLLAGALNGRR